LGAILALGALAIIGAATLTGSTDSVPTPWCLPCALRNEGLAADSILNVILFVPFGVGLRLAGVRVVAVASAALAVSLAVEVMQAYVVSGRVANVVDLAANTVGAGVAAIATPRWRKALLPSTKAAMLLALISMSGLIAIVAASAWALTPAIPRGPLIVRGVGRRAAAMRSERVLSGVVDGRTVRHRDTVRTPRTYEWPTRVDVELQASRALWRSDPALELVADGQTFLRLGIDRNELELEVRRKGEAARFLSPSVRLPRRAHQAVNGAAEGLDTLRLRAVVAPWRMSLAARTRVAHDDVEVRLHPLSGWTLLVRAPRAPWLGVLITLLWTGILFFPVAYWSAAAAVARSRLMIAVVLSVSVAALWAIGAAVGAPWPPSSAIVGAIVTVLGARRVQHMVAASHQMRRPE
jgi:hypothetical protein